MDESRTPEPRREAFFELRSGSSRARAGFRALQPEAVAGGLLELEFVIEDAAGEPFYLTVGGDRARLRPDYYSMTAGLVGSGLKLTDPLGTFPYLGGPATVVRVEPSGSFREMLLLNEFVSLEQVSRALSAGEARMLWVRCQRLLHVGASPEEVLAGPATGKTVTATLKLPVRRDEGALEALVERLAAEVRDDWSATVSAEREQAIRRLAALRHPSAAPQLSVMQDHPDPVVRMHALRALKKVSRQ